MTREFKVDIVLAMELSQFLEGILEGGVSVVSDALGVRYFQAMVKIK